jgi:CRISPR-associated protein (TIGR02584 family)
MDTRWRRIDPRMTDPAGYPRRILLAVTGLTPQIVTETLYALAVKGNPAWVPTEIRLITTVRGAQQAQRSLLSGDPGWFGRLCADYRLPGIAFAAEDISIIAGPDGKPLDDILDERDNAAVADFITEEVRALTADPHASLHVSIAGGRKTMGFYLGYALSLFGREQDRLSHVLVPPSFESKPEFFYPAPPPFPPPQAGEGQGGGEAKAQVYLGDIPFVCLRYGLPERVLQGRARFSEAVAEAQKAVPLALRLDPATRAISAGDKSFVLEPAQFAFYWMMAERCMAARGGLLRSDQGVKNELLGYYGRLVNVASRQYERTEKAYRGFDAGNFDQAKTKLNRALQRALGERRALPYLVGKLDSVPGGQAHRFGLSLPPEAVTIVPASLRTQRVGPAGSK